MTAPADPLALLAQLDALAAEATVLNTLAQVEFRNALEDSWPALAAAIRDGEARVDVLKKELGKLTERHARQYQTIREMENVAVENVGLRADCDLIDAERDAAIARADAADRRVDWLLTRGARLAAILNLCAPCGPRPDIGRLHDEQKGALDAWQEMAP